ncbi:site-specific recombinase XerD [Krasilnikovia cinnamomea]|uniref:Site-specific recombinase XerD n=1 Tax=Krasilnikovia cinnamomea TaxID=349313 RepID=A0A4V2G7B1_9ACTN|nr:tyrosine-type recombinase/integrase [Krasilnikovia cinnamomea]RZU51916.1 site-specific recombinase XerD [Krasilnikovia cinnamomea]
MNTSYDVRVWKIREHKGKDRKTGKPRSTYRVRWLVAGVDHGKSYQTRALAESFRSKLITAQREGVTFDVVSGLPEPMARELNSRSWFEHAVAYVDMKWPRASAKHRKGIAESLAQATMALFATDRGAPPDAVLRRALGTYVFNKARRDHSEPPPDLAAAVAWAASNTVGLSALADAALVRKALDSLAVLLDGKAAAASTVARKRAVFSGALRYAVELGHLDSHPMERVSWTAPKNTDEVDRQVVANPTQARALLAAVDSAMPEMTAFFGCMYYAALRPEEALHLREDEYERPKREGGWGWLHLTGATVAVGNGWGDVEGTIEHRALKHRGRNATRDVPATPALCDLLDRHIAAYPAGANGRLFVTRRGPWGAYRPTAGQPLTNNAYGTAWRKAREKALTPAQQRSPLARRPYDLRHAAVSLWLNAGVHAPQVAEWAGHSVHVLMKVYAKCVDGEQEAAKRRIEAALNAEPTITIPSES